MYSLPKSDMVEDINFRFLLQIFLVAGCNFWVFCYLGGSNISDEIQNAVQSYIMLISIIVLLKLNKERKKKIYKDRDVICDQYNLDKRLFDKIDIEHLKNNKTAQDVVNKMWFKPQHWLYTCLDGSIDLRYTQSNKIIPDEWFMVLQVNNEIYLLRSYSKKSIAQIKAHLLYNFCIDIKDIGI